ncbi:ubiquinol-cytochrome c reductase, iron-sulfur subunit [Ehrlichia chaffeensis str. Heartland]|uniref:Ubiquinol-cytochrome c reductase iron-sulfur subunit n=1 Tax=Ehrlichia chaffeensis (strain ATCC CRL-10679 / Arkansas) TaxID=205920 RepID=Q2GGU8_EHRCR|nr:ubiquinol-cytochrome c reductase iron-sulfur subunit [Ehrlichia chaffeensis]ABD44971.1 ubiquinol-cytochrome c reductase, iron-sulfur subunit [Ehrlichia chaffeensis str. Arkansas]AHX03614.1 ubiquinol-cytochrome c reductase, iron-sulfur subunit [Ehrlichia chaffeensis str. Heartland]AHX05664.1 ubiquinol-cytochrome c reductase, iron-sulfur subunit [Ehrlichia chaffeensis str. Jax]AHX06655.1 ubiquinol-cytochrome c reductase, iron-sulfur subunit [Ehrlichia chaffeensis str. Liberty]AHX07340.1 ubiqu
MNNDEDKYSVFKTKVKRRDFLGLTTLSMAGIGLFSSVYPLIKFLSPSAEVIAQSTVEVNLSDIKEGKTKVIKWQGKPVFIRKRTTQEIEEARAVKIDSLRDPQSDQERTHQGREEWLIMVGICTHLGCVPVEVDDGKKGWYCPCHGSKYDTSGRIISGPAPLNLPVPDYYFSQKDVIVIGVKGTDVA